MESVQGNAGSYNRHGTERLSREAIVRLALDIADEEGLAAVSFRRLAKDIGVTPMAIYRHVRNKDDLLDAMTEHLLADLDVLNDQTTVWKEQIRAILYELRRMLINHPAGINLLTRRYLPSANALRIFETVLDVLRKAGFEPQEAYLIFEQMQNQVILLVATEAGYAKGTDEERRAWESHLLSFYGSLSPQQYPRIVEASPNIAACIDVDRHFRFGTDLLLAGVEAMAESRRR